MRNGGMQNGQLSGECAWHIFMANHSEVQRMAYKEHAELCTLYQLASVECSWAVWQPFPHEYQSELLQRDDNSSKSNTLSMFQGLSDFTAHGENAALLSVFGYVQWLW